MLHVVLFEVSEVAISGVRVVQEVMNFIVDDVSEHETTQPRIGVVNAEKPGGREDEEYVEDDVSKDNWEDQTQSFLWEGMVDAVHEEVNGEDFWVIREPVVFGMEEKSMKKVLSKGPRKESDYKDGECAFRR
jgi:hypothetical protein